MAISLASLRRNNVPQPPRLLVYGVPGVGKTTFAAQSPSPVFLQAEDGLGTLDVPTFGLLRSYSEVMEAIGSLYAEDHDFRTAVIDTIDAMEPLVWTEAARANGWKNLETPGYGKGYLEAVNSWRAILEGLNALRDEKGMSVILLAHSSVVHFNDPDGEPYDRYAIKLHKGTAAVMIEQADAVLFANYRASTTKVENTSNKKAVRGVGNGDRVLHTTERPARLAKNRYAMPDTLPMTWDAVAQHIPFYATAYAQAA